MHQLGASSLSASDQILMVRQKKLPLLVSGCLLEFGVWQPAPLSFLLLLSSVPLEKSFKVTEKKKLISQLSKFL